ncbi:MAG: hypothetical protein ABIG84_02115 [archaeon]
MSSDISEAISCIDKFFEYKKDKLKNNDKLYHLSVAVAYAVHEIDKDNYSSPPCCVAGVILMTARDITGIESLDYVINPRELEKEGLCNSRKIRYDYDRFRKDTKKLSINDILDLCRHRSDEDFRLASALEYLEKKPGVPPKKDILEGYHCPPAPKYKKRRL